MKANKEKMFSISLKKIKPEISTPFPLYIFLKKNNRMVPISLQNNEVGKILYDKLVIENHDELWVPNEYANLLDPFLDFLDKSGSPVHSESATEILTKNSREISTENIADNEKNLDIGELIDKAEKALDDFSTIESINKPKNNSELSFAEKIKKIADDILEEESKKNHPMLQDILAMRSLQDPSEHSVFVGSLAALIALKIGRKNKEWIAKLISACTFHDIGLAQTNIIAHLHEKKYWTPSQMEDYKSHVKKGIAILEMSEVKIDSEILRIIDEHHEKIDGTGFPNGLKENQIHEGAKILFLSNLLTRLTSGEETGEKLTPLDAVDYIRNQLDASGVSKDIFVNSFSN